MIPGPPISILFPYTTLFRSGLEVAERDALIAHGDLNTAEAVHAGAVLLAHLRSIKDRKRTPMNYSSDNAHNGTTMTQAEINAAITGPVAADQLAALKDYKAA